MQRTSARHKKTRPVAPALESVSPGQLIENILNLSVGHCEGYIKVVVTSAAEKPSAANCFAVEFHHAYLPSIGREVGYYLVQTSIIT